MTMKKDALIKLIEKARRIEEEAVPAITQHIMAATNFVEKDDRVKKRVFDIMMALEKESGIHANMLGMIMDIVEKEKKDVY